MGFFSLQCQGGMLYAHQLYQSSVCPVECRANGCGAGLRQGDRPCPSPAINPATNEAVLDSLATVYADHILHLSPDAVLCQGECTFVYRVVQRLEAAGIPTLAACSRRKSQETTYPDGSTLKRSIFAFAGFRRYGSP